MAYFYNTCILFKFLVLSDDKWWLCLAYLSIQEQTKIKLTNSIYNHVLSQYARLLSYLFFNNYEVIHECHLFHHCIPHKFFSLFKFLNYAWRHHAEYNTQEINIYDKIETRKGREREREPRDLNVLYDLCKVDYCFPIVISRKIYDIGKFCLNIQTNI